MYITINKPYSKKNYIYTYMYIYSIIMYMILYDSICIYNYTYISSYTPVREPRDTSQRQIASRRHGSSEARAPR